MKRLNTLKPIHRIITILTALFFLTENNTLNSQDLSVDLISSPAVTEYAEQEIPITVDITNNSDVDILLPEASVEMSIFKEDVLYYNNIQIIPLILGGETISITTDPDGFIISEAGIYKVTVFINYGPDLIIENNFLEMDFEVVSSPEEINYQVFQIDMVNPYQIDNSTFGVFQCDYTSVSVAHYINAVASIPGSTDQIWIVQNLPMLPHEYQQTINYWFDYTPLGVFDGMDVTEIQLEVEVSEDVLISPFVVQNWSGPLSVIDLNYDVLSNNLAEIESFPPSPILGFPYIPIDTYEYDFRGCNVPNIDLENDEHSSSSSYAGDENACGPAAAANSMKWLADNNSNIEPTGQSLREIMEELSEGMDRGPGEGVTTEQLIKGKLDYVDNHGLPIHVKYQSYFNQDGSIASPNPLFGHSAENKGSTTTPTPPTWEFFKNEMDNGEDVEIMFGWYDAQGNRHGGHWVTASGYYEDANKKGIFIKDDGDQATSGGTSQSYHDWVMQDEWSRLKGYTGPNNNCWIESVVSESYDSDISHDIFGCTYFNACNYDPFANKDDGSCEYPGCSDITAINYDVSASCESDLIPCVYDTDPCIGDFNNDLIITTADLTIFLSVFGTFCEE